MASSLAALSPDERQKVITEYRSRRTELDALYSKLGVVDADRSEHELVIKQMGELDSDRRCWQQIGPVLAEKRVVDVLPVLNGQKEQLISAVKMLTETIGKQEKAIVEMQNKWSIREQ